MGAIRVKVGAALDSSVAKTFAELGQQAKRAGDTVRRELGKPLMGGGGGSMSSGPSDAQGTQKAWADAAKAAAKLQAQSVRDAKKANAEKERDYSKLQREMTREAEKGERDRQKTAEKAAKATAEARAKIIGAAGRAAGGVHAAAGAGYGFAKGVTGGMGFSLDPADAARKLVELERRSVELSNSAYMAGAKGPNGQRQDPKALIRDVGKVANETGTDTLVAAEGLQKFVGLTGDLDTGRQIFGDLAKLSKATGSNLDDMAAAAGNVSNSLEDGPEKAEQVLEVMQAIAGQGKLGAVEISDLASQMAGLAAQAGRFSGSRTETMALMGALAQESRQRGGSKSAAQAVTSVQSFSGTFDKGAREKQFAARGIKLRGDDQLLRSAQDIIVDSLVATKGNAHQMGQLFADTRARSVTRGFETIFNDTKSKATGTEQEKLDAATKAVVEEFDRLKSASMGQGEIADSFKAAMATSESATTIANNKFTQSMADLVKSIQPLATDVAGLFTSFMPAITGATSGFAQMAKDNPMATALLVGATQIKGPIGALAESFIVGKGIIDGAMEQWKTAERKTVEAGVRGAELASKGRRGIISGEEQHELESIYANRKAKLDEIKKVGLSQAGTDEAIRAAGLGTSLADAERDVAKLGQGTLQGKAAVANQAFNAKQIASGEVGSMQVGGLSVPAFNPFDFAGSSTASSRQSAMANDADQAKGFGGGLDAFDPKVKIAGDAAAEFAKAMGRATSAIDQAVSGLPKGGGTGQPVTGTTSP